MAKQKCQCRQLLKNEHPYYSVIKNRGGNKHYCAVSNYVCYGEDSALCPKKLKDDANGLKLIEKYNKALAFKNKFTENFGMGSAKLPLVTGCILGAAAGGTDALFGGTAPEPVLAGVAGAAFGIIGGMVFEECIDGYVDCCRWKIRKYQSKLQKAK